MYHGLHQDRRAPGVHDSYYSVSPEAFARQLDWLHEHGYRTRRLTDPTSSPRDVVVTFDDGDASMMTVALPLLLGRGMVAEFCITSDYVGQAGRVTRRDVRELADNGMGILSHGRTHRPLRALSDGDLSEELRRSKRDLETWCGRPVTGLSVPGGRAGRREYRAARAEGYDVLLNSTPGPNRRPGRYLHRLCITQRTDLTDFAGLVQWRGVAPRRLALRTAALEVPKRVLGDVRYANLRAVAVSRRTEEPC